MDLFSARMGRAAAWALFGLALAYAFVAGLRTVADFDVGWLLATGRYLVTYHEVPRTDVLSYTAYGVPFIYPPFGGALLYLVYTAGGFAALSWIGAITCVAVVAVAVGRPRLLTCALAILAVPSLAFRTAPRADLFTTFFFAAYLTMLWKCRRGGKGYLWLLPLIMLVWVNVHPGFAAGLVLLGAYVGQELLEFCFRWRRSDAIRRLKSATVWIALSILATLINPWGFRVYEGVLAQNRITRLHSGLAGEWSAVRLTVSSFAGAFQLRDPNSGYWWLLVFACAAAVVALYRRQFGNALLLTGAAYISVEHLRFQALFAIVVIVISGEVFSRPVVPFLFRRFRKPTMDLLFHATATVALAALALLHIADTISNRSYLANGELSVFGAGLSWWYPERAAQFIERNVLPGQLFSDYNSGGYLTLRLGPGLRGAGLRAGGYRDFADGRAIPFFPDVLLEQATLEQSSPDSAVWARAADRYGINAIILSLARSGGLEFVPMQQYCASREWKPVYLDDVSIVLVRNRPENEQWIQHFMIDCANYRIVPPRADPLAANPSSARERAELYNFYANTASIYYVLGRDNDAADAASHAEKLFTGDPGLPLLAGQLLQANGKFAEAEAQYRRALGIRRTDTGWFLLARLSLVQKKYPEAAWALQRSADLAVSPAARYQLLGNVDLAMNQPREALLAFDRAEHFEEKLAALPSYALLSAQVAEGRGRAWLALHDAKRATFFLEKSARLVPDPQRWNLLADCYSAQGRTVEAEEARNRAKELSAAR